MTSWMRISISIKTYSRLASRDGRKEAHTIQLLQPQRICDGFSSVLLNTSVQRACCGVFRPQIKVLCDRGRCAIISHCHRINWRSATAAHFRMQGNTIPLFRSIRQSRSMSYTNSI